MSNPSNSSASFAATAAREIAQLEALVAEAQRRLAEVNREVADAESRLGSTPVAQIVEANEQLVLAAMTSQTNADTAAQALDEVSRAAQLDPLTGLPNRVVLLDRLSQGIANAKRRGMQLALLFLDLNDFKRINDTLGHTVGDKVLRQIAERLGGAVRQGDTASRLGGDEFVFLLAEVAHAADAGLVAEKLIAALAAPMRVDDHVLRLMASIGISLYPTDGEDASTLLECADSAMYRAKQDGLRNVVFHSESVGVDRLTNPPVFSSMRRPLTRIESALAEQERLNELLREANERLVLVALSAQDLHAAAQQAHERQTQVLAHIAHELRNPMAPIRNAVAVMREGSSERALSRVRAIIERQVAHLNRLVDDLVDESRVRTGKLRINTERIDFVDVIDAAIDVSRPAMDIRLQALVVRVPSCALALQGDQVRLTQVLSNLLDNASKYTPEGGEIRLLVDKGDRLMTVSVSDSGIGITAEALERIFEPFVQDQHAIAFNGAGLGIGLTVVRELVEAHGGSVVANSAGKGRGSQFVVTFPLVNG